MERQQGRKSLTSSNLVPSAHLDFFNTYCNVKKKITVMIKKFFEIAAPICFTAFIFGLVFGKIPIKDQGWFSVLNLKLVLVGVLCVLIITSFLKLVEGNNSVEVRWGRKKIIFFIIFLVAVTFWDLFQKPVVGVSAELKDVAKEQDLLELHRSVVAVDKKVQQYQKTTNQQLTDMALSQKESFKSFLEALKTFKNNQEVSNSDNLKRMQVFQRNLDSFRVELALSLVQQKTKAKEPTRELFDKGVLRSIGAVTIVGIILSFISSFFWPTYTRVSVHVRRKTIPVLIGTLGVLSVVFYGIKDIGIFFPKKKNDVPTSKTDSLFLQKQFASLQTLFIAKLDSALMKTLSQKEVSTPVVVSKDTTTLAVRPPDKKRGKKGEKNAKLKASMGRPLENKIKVGSSPPPHSFQNYTFKKNREIVPG